MIVQGSGLPICVQAKARCNRHSDEPKKEVGKLQFNDNDSLELSEIGLERLELLRSIRKKIQNGFYNSDSVLDDISHGLAAAIDQQ